MSAVFISEIISRLNWLFKLLLELSDITIIMLWLCALCEADNITSDKDINQLIT